MAPIVGLFKMQPPQERGAGGAIVSPKRRKKKLQWGKRGIFSGNVMRIDWEYHKLLMGKRSICRWDVLPGLFHLVSG